METGVFGVFCPTCGAATTSVPTAEDRPLNPISVYGWTKKAQEDLFAFACTTLNIPTVVLRYFNVFGSRQSLVNPYTGIVSIFFSRLTARQPISLYEHGIPLRDFVHVSDVVEANLLTLDDGVVPGSIFNVGTGVSSSVVDVARAIGHALDAVPEFTDRGEFRVGDIHSCVADLSRTTAGLGYTPKVSLDAGMREFAQWAAQQASQDLYERTVEELSAAGLFGRAGRADVS
jgi:dTDP-L-rhamnose 4-epimerase